MTFESTKTGFESLRCSGDRDLFNSQLFTAVMGWDVARPWERGRAHDWRLMGPAESLDSALTRASSAMSENESGKRARQDESFEVLFIFDEVILKSNSIMY